MSVRISLTKRVFSALSYEWQTTRTIAMKLGHKNHPGNDLQPYRDVLYALELDDLVEHQVQHNGHLWRRADALLRDCPLCHSGMRFEGTVGSSWWRCLSCGYRQERS